MKTITLTVSDDATITVNGKEYVPKGTNAKTPERVLWTPKLGERVRVMWMMGKITTERYDSVSFGKALDAGNVFPDEGDYDLAAKRHREAQSVIDRYCYAKGIDTRWKTGVKQWGVYLVAGSLVLGHFTETCDGSPFYAESRAIAEQIIADCADAIRTVLLRGWV